jgi:hypothetical protein
MADIQMFETPGNDNSNSSGQDSMTEEVEEEVEDIQQDLSREFSFQGATVRVGDVEIRKDSLSLIAVSGLILYEVAA